MQRDCGALVHPQCGLALGLSASGASFGNFAIPPLAAGLIGLYGWRDAYLLLGLGSAAILTVCALFMVRDPEARGLYPDGIAPADVSPAARAEPGRQRTPATRGRWRAPAAPCRSGC